MRLHLTDWSKFRALEPERRRLALEAAVVAGLVSIGLRTMSVARFRRALQGCFGALRSRSRPPFESLAWSVRAAAARVHAPRTCLLEALVAEFMLRRRNYQPALRFGVRRTREPEVLDGHAWVECDGTVVVGSVAHLSEYAPLSSAGR